MLSHVRVEGNERPFSKIQSAANPKSEKGIETAAQPDHRLRHATFVVGQSVFLPEQIQVGAPDLLPADIATRDRIQFAVRGADLVLAPYTWTPRRVIHERTDGWIPGRAVEEVVHPSSTTHQKFLAPAIQKGIFVCISRDTPQNGEVDMIGVKLIDSEAGRLLISCRLLGQVVSRHGTAKILDHVESIVRCPL